MKLVGHKGYVYAALLLRDGTRAVTTSDDRTLIVWDLATGRPTSVLPGHTKEVDALAYHPTLDMLATGSDDRSVRVRARACIHVVSSASAQIWDLTTMTCVRTITCDGQAHDMHTTSCTAITCAQGP